MSLIEKNVSELKELLKNRKVSVSELVRAYFERIDEVEDKIKSYLTIVKDKALEDAARKDEFISKNGYPADKPLFGIPIAIKDNICTKGIKTTCASKILYNFVPPYDATVIKKLKDAGAIIIGKTNLDEFAMGSSTENSAFQKTCNPYDLNCVPGGSSGGSAAAIAAFETPIALGSDTGGSIRQPAAFCGIVGMKPTYGRVSRYGLVAFASSLDQIGPFAKNVKDAALLLNVLSGKDPMDNTSVDIVVPDFTEDLEKEIKGRKIAIPKEYFGAGLSDEVREKVDNCIKLFEEMGAVCEEVSLPHTEYCIATYYLIATAEASSNLARYDGVHYGYRAKNVKDIISLFSKSRAEGFGDEVKRRIMLGTYVLSAGYYDAYYLKALKVRTLIKRDFDRVFENYDVILTPTSPTPAFKFGEKTSDPLKMYLSDIYTISVNLAGTAGISINAGYSKAGLPIGMQLISRPFDEKTLFNFAYKLEKALNVFKKPQL